MKNKKLTLKESILWNSWGSMFYLGCQWLLTVLAVRLANVSISGVLSLAISVSNIWYSIATYGMRNFQVSDSNNKYKTGTYIFSRLITISFAFSGCIIYTVFMNYTVEQKLCIIIYCLYKMSEAAFDVYAGIYQKVWRMDYIGKSMMARGILTISSFVVVLVLTQNLVITMCFMSISCIVFIALYDIRIAGKLENTKILWSLKEVKNLLKECSPLMTYTLLSTAIGTIPRIFVERYFGNYELGIYAAVATPTLIIQMGATYIFNPFVTLFGESYNHKDKNRFFKVLRTSCLATGAVAVMGLIGGKIFGYWGLKLLYGEEVAENVSLLMPLIIGTILTAFAWLFCGVSTAVREFKGLVYANFTAVLCSGIFSIIFEKQFKLQGATIALCLSTVIEILILVICIVKRLKITFSNS